MDYKDISPGYFKLLFSPVWSINSGVKSNFIIRFCISSYLSEYSPFPESHRAGSSSLVPGNVSCWSLKRLLNGLHRPPQAPHLHSWGISESLIRGGGFIAVQKRAYELFPSTPVLEISWRRQVHAASRLLLEGKWDDLEIASKILLNLRWLE